MASAEKCFSFLWKLKNFSYCHHQRNEKIESPAFLVEAIEGTKWKLWLYPRGNNDEKFISCYLNREVDSKGAGNVDIKFEIAFLAEDGSVLISKCSAERVISKGEGTGWRPMAKRENVFRTERSKYLPQDTLTVRCRIWKTGGEMLEDVRCTAVSRIEVEKRSLLWNVKNFSTLEPEKKCIYQMKSIGNETVFMSVNLFVIGGLNTEENICFELSIQDEAIKFASLRLFLITSSGIKIECNQEEMWFDRSTKTKQLTFTFTKKKLLEEKAMYLPNDILSLRWEWGFSRGVVSIESEDDQYGCLGSEAKISDVETMKIDKDTSISAIVENIKSAYDEHFLSDVNLKTNNNVFPAHKFILGASSPVFKAMFSNDMKEKVSNCVNIEDLSDDAVKRMLRFIYTGRVEDLEWESASHLYVAADKYAISSLKNVCSSFLKENLSTRNACEVLTLSNFHSDVDLKSAVQDYILKNGKRIINSDEWKVWMEGNSKLAAETLSLLFK